MAKAATDLALARAAAEQAVAVEVAMTTATDSVVVRAAA
jgi:hypothetical protein